MFRYYSTLRKKHSFDFCINVSGQTRKIPQSLTLRNEGLAERKVILGRYLMFSKYLQLPLDCFTTKRKKLVTSIKIFRKSHSRFDH